LKENINIYKLQFFQSNKRKRIIPSAHILKIKIMDPQKLPPCRKWPEICSIVEQV
jgi:hypothetical protein